ncbi:MAG TPA: hypothetical protein VI033_02530 [Candidatus Nitrosopolaris sp.]
MTVIVDKELCLTAEVKDHEKDNDEYDSNEVLELATYSNSESTVLSYASIFETLWIQAELKNRQKKVASLLRKGVIAITLNLINLSSLNFL